MLPKAKTVYFHVDVNSAFLSWTAIQHLANGETLDLRTVPAVVGGDEEKRHGVVLAKSIPAKRYGIQTGESLFMARSKYPNLIVAAPDFDWYVKNSKAMIRIFGDYTPDIEQYSIDEAFLKKHFLRMMNYDFEAVIYLAMVGMRELILEADAFDHDGEQNTQNELKQAFQYVSENDVRNFAYVTHMGYSEKYFNWNIIRHQSKDEADNPLTFWLFKNAMYSLFFNLANRE